MAASGLLDIKNIIFVGDINFTVSAGEVWGKKARLDHLAGFFKGII